MATKPSSLVLPGNTPAWLFQVWAAFLVSVFAVLFGIYQVPMDRWGRAFFIHGDPVHHGLLVHPGEDDPRQPG
jgi:hypothetical protein